MAAAACTAWEEEEEEEDDKREKPGRRRAAAARRAESMAWFVSLWLWGPGVDTAWIRLGSWRGKLRNRIERKRK